MSYGGGVTQRAVRWGSGRRGLPGPGDPGAGGCRGSRGPATAGERAGDPGAGGVQEPGHGWGEGQGFRYWVPEAGHGWGEGPGVSSGRFLLPIFSRGCTGTTELTGSTNLITHYNLEHAYNKFCGKKVKEKLSNFLPDLPGMIDLPGSHDSSSLRSLIEKPPICGSSFTPLTGAMLTGFRLHAGPVSPGAWSRGDGIGPAWPDQPLFSTAARAVPADAHPAT